MTFLDAVKRARDNARDPEIQAMLDELDLLPLIQADTGEQGTRSGECYRFDNCPVCGHHDCFRYYPQTKSWECFGASNATGIEGGTAIDYYMATRGCDASQAVEWLRGFTGHQREKRPLTGSHSAPSSEIHDWTVHRADLANLPPRAPEVIHGLMREGRKGIIAGASKSYKSWLAINLAITVATGGEWLGFECAQKHVLYINMEVAPDEFPQRLKKVADAKSASYPVIADHLAYMNMRGFYGGMDALRQVIEQSGQAFEFVILDPLYKAFDGDENKARDVGGFCQAVDKLCEHMGCSFVYVHHHSKGAKGDVAAIDRASGSGVFARDPDMIVDVIGIYPPDDEYPDGINRAYQLSFELREFPPIDPMNVIVRHPLHVLDVDGITASWRPHSELGRVRGGYATGELNKARAEAAHMQLNAKLAAAYYSQSVPPEGLKLKDAAALVGCDGRKLANALEGSEFFDIVKTSPRIRYVVAKNPPRASPPTLELDGD